MILGLSMFHTKTTYLQSLSEINGCFIRLSEKYGNEKSPDRFNSQKINSGD